MNKIVDLHNCIQGEGPLMGVPHVLIRMSGCNLRCQFGRNICDTPYASWAAETKGKTLEDIKIHLKTNPQIQMLLITGGEPTYNPSLLRKICRLGKEMGKEIAIETNGSNYVPGLPVTMMVISPKLSSTIPSIGYQTTVPNKQGDKKVVISRKEANRHRMYRVNIGAISQSLENYRCALKFVVQDEADISEVREIVRSLPFQLGSLYLMPEGITPEEIGEKRRWLMERCMELGVNYSDRLHILAYGNERES